MRKTIGILTGGGDVPVLNPCIKAAETSALEEGYRVIGISRGWGGIFNNLDEPSHDYYVRELSARRTHGRPHRRYFPIEDESERVPAGKGA